MYYNILLFKYKFLDFVIFCCIIFKTFYFLRKSLIELLIKKVFFKIFKIMNTKILLFKYKLFFIKGTFKGRLG